jgi:hypothetical protein
VGVRRGAASRLRVSLILTQYNDYGSIPQVLPEDVPPFEPRSNGEAVRSEKFLVPRNVSKTFLGAEALDRVDVEIHAGESTLSWPRTASTSHS